jgi:lipoprotein-anchoring transpeptidase ErfK/SrfK
VRTRAFSTWQARRPVLAPALIVLVAVLAVGVPLLALERGSNAASEPPVSQQKEASALPVLPDPVEPAFVPGKPTVLRGSAHARRWAVVRRAVTARAAPSASAPAIAQVETKTPEGTSNIVLVLGDRVDPAGRLWIRVRLAVVDEPSTGWVPREALGGYGTVTTQLIVDLRSLQATLFRDGRSVFRADVGIGKRSWPTPRGEFYVRNKLRRYASPLYGPIAFGTSARSRVLTDWPAGGFVGIHGTDRPDLLPGRVSHGCIRMRNDEILRLAKLMPVGTPLTIR